MTPTTFDTGKVLDTSYLISNKDKVLERDFNSAYNIYINKSVDKRVNSNIFEKDQEKQLILEFTIFHELAHSSYPQMLSNDYQTQNEKEVNSDISAIIKLVKIHDFNTEDASKLCEMLLKYRAKHATYKIRSNSLGYMGGGNNTRYHFTEESILNIRSMLRNENSLIYIKELRDTEISTFSEMFHKEFKELNNYTVKNLRADQKKLIVETILTDTSFFKTIKEDYDSTHAYELSKYSHIQFEVMLKNYPATEEFINKVNSKIKEICCSNQEAFKDLFITHQLRTNYKNYLDTINHVPAEAELINQLKNDFDEYRSNKSKINISANKTTTSTELRGKLKL